MKSKIFVEKAMDIATNYKTLYIMGCFGAPMSDKNKSRYCANHSYNSRDTRKSKIQAASADTFGFDCVCLIKGILWGWEGDESRIYGGAGYAINGVPDIDAGEMFDKCTEASSDFSKVMPGEVVWMPGHIGIYIGDGLAVEATPIWEDGVQVTAVANMGNKEGHNARTWTSHGKLPYIDYSDQDEPKPEVTYQVYAGGRWLRPVTGSRDCYAGVFGKAISGLRVKLSNGKNVAVWSHIGSKKGLISLLPVTEWDCIAMKAEGCQLKYRVHVLGGSWLPWVTGCDIGDKVNGYAGVLGKSIDAVQIDVE